MSGIFTVFNEPQLANNALCIFSVPSSNVTVSILENSNAGPHTDNAPGQSSRLLGIVMDFNELHFSNTLFPISVNVSGSITSSTSLQYFICESSFVTPSFKINLLQPLRPLATSIETGSVIESGNSHPANAPDHIFVTPSGISDKVNALHSLNTPSS